MHDLVPAPHLFLKEGFDLGIKWGWGKGFGRIFWWFPSKSPKASNGRRRKTLRIEDDVQVPLVSKKLLRLRYLEMVFFFFLISEKKISKWAVGVDCEVG